MNVNEILQKIKDERSPLLRQLTMVGLINRLLEEQGKPAPVLIGGLALSYYSREVYFTSDIDLAYSDRQSLDGILVPLGFAVRGRYWVHIDLDMAVEAPTAYLPEECAPREVIDLEDGLHCIVIGIEDLVIDRLNACRHWRSEIDCEMTEILVARYEKEMDWEYLQRKASLPENDTWELLQSMKKCGNRE